MNNKYRYKRRLYLLAELSELSGVSVSTIRARLNRGWTTKEAVETPVRQKSASPGTIPLSERTKDRQQELIAEIAKTAKITQKKARELLSQKRSASSIIEEYESSQAGQRKVKKEIAKKIESRTVTENDAVKLLEQQWALKNAKKKSIYSKNGKVKNVRKLKKLVK